MLTDRGPMASINVRIPRELFDWLSDQAAENGTTVSQEVRSAIAAALVNAGDAKRYGVDVEELAES